MDTVTRGFLRTLRRIPDDVVLAVATRDLDLNNPQQCLCGWAIREQLAAMNGVAAEEKIAGVGGVIVDRLVPEQAAALFGGTSKEWTALYLGVQGCVPGGWGNYFPAVADATEEAFARRVAEAAR